LPHVTGCQAQRLWQRLSHLQVVCALGQQSVGKSYQLNHLGGVFFDVAGGRCTDGVWLSARHFADKGGRETLVLFMDCEGIGSLERTGTEDMLHCLLAGAVASFTIFKTHFAFNRHAEPLLRHSLASTRLTQSALCMLCMHPDDWRAVAPHATLLCMHPDEHMMLRMPQCSAIPRPHGPAHDAAHATLLSQAPWTAIHAGKMPGHWPVCSAAHHACRELSRVVQCRELTEMLHRMNKGAQKVGDISGSNGEELIFRGGIMFCLKDVQRDALRPSVAEFTSKIKGFVQGGQNFVSSLYKNNVRVGEFAPLSRPFFKTLLNVRPRSLPCTR
jgi:hypothetical protein